MNIVKTQLIFLVAIFLVLPGHLLAQPTPPVGKKWEKVSALSDEFDVWNGTKWTKSLWNYDVPVQMKAGNSGVSDGKLWIKATLDNTSERWFETSRVMSRTRISYPMYTECKIKTAHISAYNTFWLNNGNSANRDEIDVIENNSKPSCACQPDFPWQMNSQYFIVVDNSTERNKGNFDNRDLSDTNALKGIKWNEAYHTVGVWWKDANNIQFYLDGEPAGKVKSTRNFTRELNIIWDLWTFDADWLGGLALKGDLSVDSINTMRVDWIHTYKLVDGPPVPLESVSLVDSVSLDANTQIALSVVVKPANSTERDFKWSSRNEQIATVNETGIVSGHDTGKTWIIIEAMPGGQKDSCLVTVYPEKIKVSEVVVVPGHLTMEINTSVQLEARVFPVEAYNKEVTWQSGNVTVATVDSSGTVSALKTGNVTIYATSSDGGIISTCKILIMNEMVHVQEVLIEQDSIELLPGQSVTLTAQIIPDSATVTSIEWYSTDPEIASVDYMGKIAAKRIGTTSITASAELKKDSVLVIVKQASNITNLLQPTDIGFYPNPANSFLTLTGLENLPFTRVSIRNLQGQTILEQKGIDNKDPVLRLEHIPAGIYILTIFCNTGIKSMKLIKSEI